MNPPPPPIITQEAMPPDIVFILGAILVGGLALFALIPLLIGYWRMTRSSLLATHEVYERNGGPKKLHETLGTLLGLLVLDVVIYVVNMKIINEPMPSTLLYPLIAIIDGFFLFFAFDGLLMMGILKARKFYLERRMHRRTRPLTDQHVSWHEGGPYN